MICRWQIGFCRCIAAQKYRKFPKSNYVVLQRIKQNIDSKWISVSAFEKSVGMSNASFGKSLKSGGRLGVIS